MNLLNVAIIGVSGYGRYVLESFLPLVTEKRLRFLAATVIDAGDIPETCALLRSMDCEIFTDYLEMLQSLNGKIDLCIIPTGIDWHLPMACAAMKYGANVLVEKPLAGSIADARKILAAARKWNRLVFVGFQDMCSEPVLEIKRSLVRGEVGRLKRIRAIGIWPRSSSYYSRNGWAGRLYRDGRAVFDSPLNNAFAHLLNLALFFAGSEFSGMAAPVRVSGNLFRTYPIESFDTASIHVTTELGVEIHGYVSHACLQEISPRLVIEGTRGKVEWNHEEQAFVHNYEQQSKRFLSLEKVQDLRITLARSIVTFFENGKSLVNDAKNALSHAVTIERLHASSVIEDMPKQYVKCEGDMFAIGRGETWLREGFERGTSLTINRLNRIGQ